MIEKMTKYSFILLSGETEEFLKWLQSKGVVDVSRSVKPVDEKSSQMFDKIASVRKTISILEALDYSKDPDYDRIREGSGSVVIEGCKAKNTLGAVSRLDELKSELSDATRQLKDVTPWGEYDKEALKAVKGLKIRYYCVSKKVYDPEWENDWAIVRVNEDNKNIWFVTVAPEDAE